MPDFGNSTLFKGSNITAERLRFDFNHDEKLTLEQLSEVEPSDDRELFGDVFVYDNV